MLADVGICAGIFVALARHPYFDTEAGLANLGLAAIVGMGLVTGAGWQIILWRFRAYESNRRGSLTNLVGQLVCADAVGGLVLAAAIFTLDLGVAPFFPFALAGLLLASQTILAALAHFTLRRVRRRGLNVRSILLVGTGPRARAATDSIESHPEWGLKILGYLDDGGSDPDFAASVPFEKIHKLIELPTLLRNETVDEVLVACPRAMLIQLPPVVQECAMVGIPVTLMTDLFGEQLPAPRVGTFDATRTLSFAPVHHNDLELLLKRGVDIVGAMVGLILCAPIVGLAALAIRLDSKGPILFRQVRVGLNGRRFEIIKLRTMTVGADRMKSQLMHLNEMDGPVFKLHDDPRVTAVGSILRKLSIDEFPQFWNVLAGEMSLVGPRPPTPDEVIHYEGDTRRRLSMRPGLTCYWQVSGRNNLSFAEWIKLDLYYIDTFSILNDLLIILRTIPTVLFARGAR